MYTFVVNEVEYIIMTGPILTDRNRTFVLLPNGTHYQVVKVFSDTGKISLSDKPRSPGGNDTLLTAEVCD